MTRSTKHTLLLLPLLALPQTARAQRSAIELSAANATLPPDGKSRTTITARVFVDGNPIADGTRIRFSTTAGRLDTDTAETRGGIARVTLTAADQPIIARLTANIDGVAAAVPAEATVSFVLGASTGPSRRPWIRIESPGYVGYAFGLPIAGSSDTSDRAYVYASKGPKGTPRFQYGNLSLTADRFQLDIRNNRLRAEGDVVLKRGAVTRQFNRLLYDLNQDAGAGERQNGYKVEEVLFSGPNWDETPPNSTKPFPRAELALIDQSDAELTVVSRSIALEQEDARRIQFRNATFYYGNQKAFSLPLHTMSQGQQTLFEQQIVGYGPSGITFDFPLYYDVRPSALGTLHVRRGAQFGSSIYSQRPGWNLDVDQSYEGRGGDGLFQILGATRDDRGLRLRHTQHFNQKTEGGVQIDSPNTRDLYFTGQFDHQFPLFRLSLYSSGSRTNFRDSLTQSTSSGGDLRGQVFLETYSKPVPKLKAVRYTLNVGVQAQRFFGNSATPTLREVRQQNAGMRFLTTPLPVAPRTTFTQSVLVGHTWVQGSHGTGVSLQGTSSVSRSLGSLGSVALSYDYQQRPALITGSIDSVGKHRLGIFGDVGNFHGISLSLFATRSLDRPQSSVSASLSRPFSTLWEGRIRLSDTRYSAQHYREVEYGVARQLGKGVVAAYYSTATKRLQFDLTGLQRF